MGLISRIINFTAGQVIKAADMNGEFDNVHNLVNGNIDNNNIKSGAAIDQSKVNNLSATHITLTDVKMSRPASDKMQFGDSAGGDLTEYNVKSANTKLSAASSSGSIFTTRLDGESYDRFSLQAGGNNIFMGNGSSEEDVRIQRLATKTLRVSDKTNNDLTLVDFRAVEFAVNGRSTGEPVAFSVHRNGANQSIPDMILTKIQFTTEIFDTNSNFDNATNYRFTPTAAGKYLLTANITWDTTTSAATPVSIYMAKNGSVVNTVQQVTTTSAAHSQNISVVVDANGTTDYFELHVFHVYGASLNILGDFDLSYFMGHRIAFS